MELYGKLMRFKDCTDGKERQEVMELLERKTKWQEFDDRSLNAAYDIFEDIPEGGETDDALTEVFEGLMSWAVPASVGKELGEYYSPRQVVELAAGTLRDGSSGVDLTGVDLTGSGMLGKETKEAALVSVYDAKCIDLIQSHQRRSCCKVA